MRFFALFISLFLFLIEIDSKRQSSPIQRNIFLVEQGYCTKISKCKVPSGYEVDYIVPLYAGGADLPSNMQLLTKEDHWEKSLNDRKIYAGNYFESVYLLFSSFFVMI